MRGGYHEAKIDRDTLQVPDAFIEDLDDARPEALRSMLDGLWQAAGRERCPFYDESGRWTPIL